MLFCVTPRKKIFVVFLNLLYTAQMLSGDNQVEVKKQAEIGLNKIKKLLNFNLLSLNMNAHHVYVIVNISFLEVIEILTNEMEIAYYFFKYKKLRPTWVFSVECSCRSKICPGCNMSLCLLFYLLRKKHK